MFSAYSYCRIFRYFSYSLISINGMYKTSVINFCYKYHLKWTKSLSHCASHIVSNFITIRSTQLLCSLSSRIGATSETAWAKWISRKWGCYFREVDSRQIRGKRWWNPWRTTDKLWPEYWEKREEKKEKPRIWESFGNWMRSSKVHSVIVPVCMCGCMFPFIFEMRYHAGPIYRITYSITFRS